MKTILDTLRARAIAWAGRASLEELSVLPESILLGTKDVPVVKSRFTNRGNRFPRSLKKMRRKTSKEDTTLIRERMSGLAIGSPEYKEMRNTLSKELGLSRRPVASATNGFERAAKRKAGQKKK